MTASPTPTSSTVRARLQRGESIAFSWLSLGSPALAEIAAMHSPGAVVLDLQHGLWDRVSIESAVGLARTHTPVLARVTENRPYAISHALDAGAQGVIVPLVETAEQAAFAVSCSRYPPLGGRSSGGTRPLLQGMDAARTNDELAVGVMIETMAGVANAEAIVATPGIDFVFIGPGDLRLSKGVADPKDIREECGRVRAICDALDVPCGIFTLNLAAAMAQLDAGYRLVVAASDFGLAAGGFSAARAGLAARHP